jgi:hypothetical protein
MAPRLTARTTRDITVAAINPITSPGRRLHWKTHSAAAHTRIAA